MAYVNLTESNTILSVGVDVKQSKGSPKKRKKTNEEVKSVMEVQDETRQKMTDAFILLANSAGKSNISERELIFQKEVWESKKHTCLIS